MKKVIWVGGPKDGEEFHVKDDTYSITMYASPHNSFRKDIEPTDQIPLEVITLDIKLTPNGYRIYWPYPT